MQKQVKKLEIQFKTNDKPHERIQDLIFLQLLINGFSLGITYGIIAVGFALIVSTTGVFHIAHSAAFLTGGYLFFILVRLVEAPLFMSIIIALVGAGMFGLLIDKTIYLPIILRRGGGIFTVFIASMGVAMIVDAVFLLLFRGISSVARTQTLSFFSLGPANVRELDVLFGILGSIVYLCLYFWLYRAKTGLAIRGLADNPTLALGFIDAARTRSVVFIIGSVLAGLGGIITAYDSGITPNQGWDALFVGIVVLVVGGMQNIVLGTLVAGMLLGVVKVFSGYFFPGWFHFFVFLTLVISIIVRPEGLVSVAKD